MQIDIIEIAGNWPDHEALFARLRTAATRTITRLELDFTEQAELSIALSDNQHVRLLNRDFRNSDRPTNVLSFPVDDTPVDTENKKLAGGLLGDIILASETIAGEAERDGKTFADHVVHLTIHGFLHLLGFNHETENEAEIMEKLEIALLAEMDIADPYNDRLGMTGTAGQTGQV